MASQPPHDAPLTDPAGFVNPFSLGNKLGRLAWRIVWPVLFRPTPPRLARRWRNFLLRLFGARVGRAYVHSSCRIWAPWKLVIGDDVYVDERVYLYNPFGIELRHRITISQGCFLCTASHDHTHPRFPLIGGPIIVENDCWIAAEAFISPGKRIGEGSVVGARSVVVKDVAPRSVVAGNPARFLKERRIDHV